MSSEEQQEEMQLEEPESLIPGFSSITHLSNEGIKRMLVATRAFQSLPSSGPAWDLQKSYPEFNKAVLTARKKLSPMITALLRHAKISAEEFKFGDIDEKFDALVEANDDFLERIGLSLDEADGLFKKTEKINITPGASRPPGTWGKRKAEKDQSGPFPEKEKNEDEPKMSNREIKRAVFRRTVKEKPQIHFKIKVDNSLGPFIPKLKEKYNSIKPLSILPEYTAKNEEFYGHPYTVELNKWEPFDSMLTKVNSQTPKKLEDTPLVEINTSRDIEQLLRDLYPVSELAIDLEHHAYRSFLGFTCLIQISTRDKDYIIDALALREHLHHLNEIFTNPKIVKVFHGSTSDVEWLQKDFGLYLVNMFDTQIAAKLLGFQQLGLQALLDKYCGVAQNKTFQLADWRIRPLPKDMIHYARQDTHSLLYIYDMLRNELIDAGNDNNNLILSAYDQSKTMCLKRYEKPGNNPKLALRKMRRSLNNRQVYAFMELYKWRDALAREKDESIAFVLPNHMLLMISEQLPKEMTGILACCDPIPNLVQNNLGVMHKIITAARQLTLQENTHEEKSEKRKKQKDWVVIMNSVHDVDLDEITEASEATAVNIEDEEEQEDTEKNSSHDQPEQHTLQEWPQPLNEPRSDNSPITQIYKPTIFFNKRIKLMPKSSIKSIKKDEYLTEAASTPFDRYQLSKEIIELLSDPIKKDALDMENPVIKAIYETVFCDPSELDQKTYDEKPHVLEKVFTEGEFIPFNPLAGSSQPKKRKRTAWDDNSVQKNEDSAGTSKPKAVKLEVIELDDEEEEDDEVDMDQSSSSKLGEFMSVPNGKEKKKKKSKGGKILNKLKAFRNKVKKVKTEPVAEHSSPNTRGKKSSPAKNNFAESSPNRGRNNRRSSRKAQKDNNDQKGGKFFNFRNRGSGGRSMTFK